MGKVYCQICNKRCKGDVLKVHDKYIHKSCFLCCCCKTSLEKGGFFLKDEKYYCKNDYLENFGVKCKVCNEIAEGEVIVIFATTFHPNCFKCRNCVTIFQRGDKVTLCNGEYLCCNCIYLQDVNLNGRKDVHQVKPDETMTIKKETHPDELDAMTTSMISTNISDSSEAESITPEKKYFFNRPFSNVPREPNIESTETKRVIKDDNQSSNSECLSIKTEPGYDRGDDSDSMKNYNYRGSISSLKPPQSPMQLGKFYNFSYLSLEEKLKNQFHPRALYGITRSNVTTSSSNIHHFHKIDNFSYRSSPNVTINKRGVRAHNLVQILNDKKSPRIEAAPTKDQQKSPKITKSCLSVTKPILINGSSQSVTNEAADTSTLINTMKNVTTFKEYQSESKERSTLSLRPARLLSAIDPISASRTPNASYEPLMRPRYDRHMFTSPSRQIVPMDPSELSRMMSTENIVKDDTRSDIIPPQSQLLTAYKPKSLVTRSQVICSKPTTDHDHISVQSFLRSYSREKLTEDRKPKIYPYEQLKISNFALPKGVERSQLEIYLSENEFEIIFKLSRVAFNRLPEWKRNDLKKRVDLF